MNTRTYSQRFKSIASRLRFISKEFRNIDDDDCRHALGEALEKLKEEAVSFYGERIANEVYWKVEEK